MRGNKKRFLDYGFWIFGAYLMQPIGC